VVVFSAFPSDNNKYGEGQLTVPFRIHPVFI